MLLSEKETRALCQTMLTCVKAEDAEVSVASEDFSHLRFAANAFTTSGRREDVSATVTVWVEKKRGSATVGNLDHSSLKSAVEQAEEIARLSPEDQEYLPTLPAQHYKPCEGYVEGTLHFSLAERARAIENIVRACEKAGVIGAGFHQTSGQTAGFATKHGNFFYRRASLAGLSVTARTPDGGSSGYFLRNHFDVAKLDALRIGREAIHKALTARNPRVLEPGIYPLILEAQAAGDLLHFDFDARSADEGRSAYSAAGGKTRLGQQVFDPRVSICSDPWHSEVPASSAAPEGILAEKIDFIRNGILKNLQYSRYWASQKGKPPTPGPVNAIFESYATPVSIEEMIGTMPRGLLVSRFWYIRKVDPRTELFTGLTRDGLWYVENGKIQYPVRNFRFNQSLLELLAPGNVHLVGKPERISGSESQGRSAVLVPPLKVKAFHFTSPSDAI